MTALNAGEHAVAIALVKVVTDEHIDTAQPVTLELRPGTIVLIEVRWRRRGPFERPPSARFRVLPTGFAHSGRWGDKMARQLGWPLPADAQRRLVADR